MRRGRILAARAARTFCIMPRYVQGTRFDLPREGVGGRSVTRVFLRGTHRPRLACRCAHLQATRWERGARRARLRAHRDARRGPPIKTSTPPAARASVRRSLGPIQRLFLRGRGVSGVCVALQSVFFPVHRPRRRGVSAIGTPSPASFTFTSLTSFGTAAAKEGSGSDV